MSDSIIHPVLAYGTNDACILFANAEIVVWSTP
jgi:hypothetical protein